MPGPYTTISVEDYLRLKAVVDAADEADLGHGPNCLAMASKPCTCGLEDLDIALGNWGAANDRKPLAPESDTLHQTNGDEYEADQNAE